MLKELLKLKEKYVLLQKKETENKSLIIVIYSLFLLEQRMTRKMCHLLFMILLLAIINYCECFNILKWLLIKFLKIEKLKKQLDIK